MIRNQNRFSSAAFLTVGDCWSMMTLWTWTSSYCKPNPVAFLV